MRALLAVLALSAAPAHAASFTDGMNAALVLGQPGFTTNFGVPIQSGMQGAAAVAFDAGGSLWVVDGFNNRILRFDPAFSNGMNASYVLGQADFTTLDTANDATHVSAPDAIAIDASSNVWVADQANSRVVVFQPPFSSNGQAATFVLGQPDLDTNSGGFASDTVLLTPTGVAVDPGGNVWVADGNANRVLRFSAPFSNGMAADLVLGQSNFTNITAGNPATQHGLWGPAGLHIDASSNVWVVDGVNSRVLEFSPPFSNNMDASLVLGEPDFTHNAGGSTQALMTFPTGVFVDASSNVWVADQSNNRVLMYPFPLTNGMNATVVLGQPDYTTVDPATTQSGLTSPQAMTADASGNMWVADFSNSRVLEFGPAVAGPPPSVPGTAAIPFTGVTSGGLTFNWTTGGNAGTPLYEADISTDSAFLVFTSSLTRNVNAAYTGLSANATYYAKVKVSDDGSAQSSAFGTPVSTSTLAVAPSVPTFTSVSSFSVTAAFASTNKAVVKYQAQISSAPDFSGTVSTSTFSAAASFTFSTALLPSTTYYVAVRAQGNNGDITAFSTNGSTITLPGTPGSAAIPFTSVTTGGLTFNWTTGGNSGTPLYEADISTDSAFGVFTTSLTYNTNAAYTGLFANATYFAKVKISDNGSGLNSSFGTTASTSTLAAAPSAPTVTAVSSYTVAASFASSNKAVVMYQAHISSAADYSGTVSTSTFSTSTSFTFSTGLLAATTYYLAVRAQGNNGDLTAFSANASTVTDPAPPLLAPSDAHLTGLFMSSATASWTLVSGATGYLVAASPLSANPPTVIDSVIEVAAPPANLPPGLSTNATYYFFIRSHGPGIATPYTLFATSVTLADAPTGALAAGVTNTGLSISWGAATNPAGTQYTAQAATDSLFSAAASSVTLNVFAAFSGLTPNTTYFNRVKAVNFGGASTAYSATVTTATEANAPVTPVATPNSSSQITMGWGANSNPTGSRYTAQLSTASDFTGTLTSVQASVESAVFGSLATATTYYLRVQANGFNGTDTAFSASTNAVTAATPPDTLSGTVKTPLNAGINLVEVVVTPSVGASQTTHTDANGAWSVSGLATGGSNSVSANYTVKDVASSIYQEGHLTGESAIALVVDIQFTLGGVYGTLRLTPTGLRPASAGGTAFVEVYQAGRLAGKVPVDAQGNFNIPNLLPGHYDLRSFDGASYSPMSRVEVQSGRQVAVGFSAELMPESKVYFYPNPARDHAVIRFETGVPSLKAEAWIFDITGALVRRFDDADAARSGAEVSWTWDLTNSGGRAVASGVYLVQVRGTDPATGHRALVTKKLAVVR